ncbi:MAG: cation transporter [Candidatus Omnitrophica bacterium]|nr:cation transporter [Candidatus Omnitrophota bacterium]MDE2221521.1 cation transporter [Candidatus Omnitrophota bacterium]
MVFQSPKVPSRFDRSLSTVLIGLSFNVFLAAVKIIAGLVGSSYALVADGIESTLDIFSSMVVLGGIKISEIPADEDHPYGHGRAESLAAMTVSLILVLVGLSIAVKSVLDIMQPHHTPAAFTLVVLVIAILVKETLFRFVFAVGESVNSLSVKADAFHHRSDAMTSLAAFTGISIAIIGGPKYQSADAWAALAASGIIMFNGIHMLRSAVKEIMDHAPAPQTEEAIRGLAGKVAGVVAIEKCKVRKSGIELFVDIHVEVDGSMPVHRAHAISHDVKDALIASPLGIADVLVHIEPAAKTTSPQGR